MLNLQLHNSLFVQKQLPAMNPKAKVTLLYGSAGSAKSYSLAQFDIIKLLSHKKSKQLLIRKVFRTHRHSTFAEINGIINDWQISPLFQINKSDLTITAKHNGNQIIFLGADDPEKIKSVAGITSARIEESTELTKDDYLIIASRLRQKGFANNIVMSFNPISSLHWIKREFFDSTDAHKYQTIHSTWQDNQFLPEDYGNTLLDLGGQNSNFNTVYYKGEWGSLTDLVFNSFRTASPEELNILDRTNPLRKTITGIYQGADWGFNDPTVFSKIAISKTKLYVLDALFLRQKTTPELIVEAKKFFNTDLPIVGDSSEPARIKEFRNNGINIRGALKGKDSISAGIDYLKRFEIIIPPHLIEVKNEFESYCYKRDNKTGELTDEPVDAFNHFIDGARYSLEVEINRYKAKAVPARMIGL